MLVLIICDIPNAIEIMVYRLFLWDEIRLDKMLLLLLSKYHDNETLISNESDSRNALIFKIL